MLFNHTFNNESTISNLDIKVSVKENMLVFKTKKAIITAIDNLIEMKLDDDVIAYWTNTQINTVQQYFKKYKNESILFSVLLGVEDGGYKVYPSVLEYIAEVFSCDLKNRSEGVYATNRLREGFLSEKYLSRSDYINLNDLALERLENKGLLDYYYLNEMIFKVNHLSSLYEKSFNINDLKYLPQLLFILSECNVMDNPIINDYIEYHENIESLVKVRNEIIKGIISENNLLKEYRLTEEFDECSEKYNNRLNMQYDLKMQLFDVELKIDDTERDLNQFVLKSYYEVCVISLIVSELMSMTDLFIISDYSISNLDISNMININTDRMIKEEEINEERFKNLTSDFYELRSNKIDVVFSENIIGVSNKLRIEDLTKFIWTNYSII